MLYFNILICYYAFLDNFILVQLVINVLLNNCCDQFAYIMFLMQDYYKALEDADEKVQLANQIYDLVSKIENFELIYMVVLS